MGTKKARTMARHYSRRRYLSSLRHKPAIEERRGVALVAYFFFLAAVFFFGDALFLAGFDVFLAICFSFFAAVVLTGGTCVPSAHLQLGPHCGEL